jgi:hypothetical protein
LLFDQARSVLTSTFSQEAQQYAFDQSLANSENTGMVAAMFVNLVLLVAVIAVIWYFINRKNPRI